MSTGWLLIQYSQLTKSLIEGKRGFMIYVCLVKVNKPLPSSVKCHTTSCHRRSFVICRSPLYPQFYSLHLTKPKVVEGEGGDRKGDRWRQKSKQLKFFFMGSEERVRSGSVAEGRESPSIGEATPTTQQLAPYKVQVIDVITRTDGIRPYSLYVLLVRREGGEIILQCTHCG